MSNELLEKRRAYRNQQNVTLREVEGADYAAALEARMALRSGAVRKSDEDDHGLIAQAHKAVDANWSRLGRRMARFVGAENGSDPEETKINVLSAIDNPATANEFLAEFCPEPSSVSAEE